MYNCDKCKQTVDAGYPQYHLYTYRPKSYPGTTKIGKEIVRQFNVCYECYKMEQEIVTPYAKAE